MGLEPEQRAADLGGHIGHGQAQRRGSRLEHDLHLPLAARGVVGDVIDTIVLRQQILDPSHHPID